MQIQDFVKAYEGRPDEELVQLAAALALLCRIKFGTSRMRSLSEFWEFTESTKLRITALFISNMEMRLDDSNFGQLSICTPACSLAYCCSIATSLMIEASKQQQQSPSVKNKRNCNC